MSDDLRAMLNRRGGQVLIGVDTSGKIVGQDVSDATLREVAQEIGQIEPPAFPSIEKWSLGSGRGVLCVTVPQGQSRPYAYRGRWYVRVGSTTQQMSGDEVNRMLSDRLHTESRWENRPAEGWTVADLDTTEITVTVEEAIRRGRLEDPGTRDPLRLLQGLGLQRDGVLLRAAVVLFGKTERIEREYTQCLLRAARFRGTDKTEFIDNRQFRGNAFRLLNLADRFLREHIPIAGRIVPGLFERVDDPLYPPLATREALANAFCHRDYSIGGGSVGVAIYDDRLEITSSGTLHFGLRAEDLYEPHESLPFNPLIARAFYLRGLIEQWGRGTLKMVQMVEGAGLPRPEIVEAGGGVAVVFRRGISTAPRQVQLSERQQELLTLLAAKPAGMRDLRQSVSGDVSEAEIKEELTLLKGLGLVEAVGRGRGAVWRIAGAAMRSKSEQSE